MLPRMSRNIVPEYTPVGISRPSTVLEKQLPSSSQHAYATSYSFLSHTFYTRSANRNWNWNWNCSQHVPANWTGCSLTGHSTSPYMTY
jgi:hypothetical protein